MAGYLPTATLGDPGGSYGDWHVVDGTPQWTGSFGPPRSGSSNGVNTGSVNPFASLLTNAMSGTQNSTAAKAPGQYSSAITAGPVWDSGTLNSMLGTAKTGSQSPGFSPAAGLPNMSSAQSDAMNQTYGNLLNSGYQSGATNLQRGASQANAAQTLASEQARANSGISGGNFLQGLAQQNWQTYAPIYNWGLNSLLSMAG